LDREGRTIPGWNLLGVITDISNDQYALLVLQRERKFAVKIGYGSICSPFLNHVSPDNWFSVRIGDYATYRECLLGDRHSSSNVWQILRWCRIDWL
jgi:hypothetical protein